MHADACNFLLPYWRMEFLHFPCWRMKFLTFHADIWNFFTFHAEIWNFLLSMLTYVLSLLSILTYGISLLSMLTYGISLLSMLTMEFHQLLADSILILYISFRISSYNLFIFYGKRRVPLEYFSFLNWCQTAVSPQIFQFIIPLPTKL